MSELSNIVLDLQNIANFEFINLENTIADIDAVITLIASQAVVGNTVCSCEKLITYAPKCYQVPGLPVPSGNLTFGTPGIGYTAISQPFSYSGTDATGFTAKVDGVSIGNVTSPIVLNSLTPATAYEIEVTPINAYGTGVPVSTTVTTIALGQTVTNGVGNTAGSGGGSDNFEVIFGSSSVTATTLNQEFTYTGNDALGFLLKVNGGAQNLITSPIDLTGLTPETLYTLQVAPFNNGGTGAWASTDLTTLATTPEGTITIGTVVVGHTHMTIPFTYSLNDVTGFKYTLNGGAETPCTSPIELSGLSEDTAYTIEIIPYNSTVAGTPASTTQTTLEPLTSGVLSVTSIYSSGAQTYDFSFTYTGNDIALFTAWYVHGLWSDYGLSNVDSEDIPQKQALIDAAGATVFSIGNVVANQTYSYTGLPNSLSGVSWFMTSVTYGSSPDYPYPE